MSCVVDLEAAIVCRAIAISCSDCLRVLTAVLVDQDRESLFLKIRRPGASYCVSTCGRLL